MRLLLAGFGRILIYGLTLLFVYGGLLFLGWLFTATF